MTQVELKHWPTVDDDRLLQINMRKNEKLETKLRKLAHVYYVCYVCILLMALDRGRGAVGRLRAIQGGPKSKQLPNLSKIVLKRIKTCLLY